MTKSPALNIALTVFLRFLLITPFNILFMAIPGMITFSLIVLIWAVSAILFTASFATPIIAIQTELVSLSFWSVLATFSTSLFAFFASVFLGIITFLISKHFVFYIFDYIKWNYKFLFKSSKLT
jgi:hypothetical protein